MGLTSTPIEAAKMTGLGEPESYALMRVHRAEAQRRVARLVEQGFAPHEAVARCARPIRAARRAQIQYRAELAFAEAG